MIGEVVSHYEILDKLGEVAPVFAIQGNIDTNSPLPSTAIVRAGPATIYVLHDLKELNVDPLGFDIVVSGLLRLQLRIPEHCTI